LSTTTSKILYKNLADNQYESTPLDANNFFKNLNAYGNIEPLSNLIETIDNKLHID
jgi:hypothetical protein